MSMTKTQRLQAVLDSVSKTGKEYGCIHPQSACTAETPLADKCLWCLAAELAGAKIEDEADRIDTLEDLFYEGAGKAHEEPMVGWWDSCAKRPIKDAGDELVTLGVFERHPEGVGRRWFYRPIKQPEDAT